MSVIHCELQSSLSKTDSLSLNQSGAFSKLLLRTQQMRATAQNLLTEIRQGQIRIIECSRID